MSTIDVVITTYRRDLETLKRALNSVLGQTVDSFHVFVVDDSGPDSSYALANREYFTSLGDERISYLQNAENEGANASRNRGILAGDAEYVAFLDDDDEWFPDKLEEQLARLDERHVAHFSSFEIINQETRVIKPFILSMDEPTTGDLLEGVSVGPTSGALVRRDVLVEAGLFLLGQPAYQDFELWLRLSELGPISCSSKLLYRYYVHAGEKISAHPDRKYRGLRAIYDKYRNRIESDDIAIHYFCSNLALYAGNMGDKKKAFSFLGRAVAAQPQDICGNLKSLVKIASGYNSRM